MSVHVYTFHANLLLVSSALLGWILLPFHPESLEYQVTEGSVYGTYVSKRAIARVGLGLGQDQKRSCCIFNIQARLISKSILCFEEHDDAQWLKILWDQLYYSPPTLRERNARYMDAPKVRLTLA